jgi:hypothetical protein
MMGSSGGTEAENDQASRMGKAPDDGSKARGRTLVICDSGPRKGKKRNDRLVLGMHQLFMGKQETEIILPTHPSQGEVAAAHPLAHLINVAVRRRGLESQI